MGWRFWGLSALASSIFAVSRPSIQEKDNSICYGVCSFRDQRFSHKQVIKGTLNALDCIFEAGIEVQGTSHFHQSSILHPANIKGFVTLADSKVHTKLSVQGFLHSKDSELHEVVLFGENISFDNSNVSLILMKKNNKTRQVVKLTGKSKVGKIVFESGKGVVEYGMEVELPSNQNLMGVEKMIKLP